MTERSEPYLPVHYNEIPETINLQRTKFYFSSYQSKTGIPIAFGLWSPHSIMTESSAECIMYAMSREEEEEEEREYEKPKVP